MLYKTVIIIFLLFASQSFSQLNVDSLWNVHNKSTNEETKIKVLSRLAKYYLYSNNTDSSLILSQKVLDYAKRNDIDSIKGEAYSKLTLIYIYKDQHSLALKFSNKALEYAVKSDNKLLQSIILGNIAIIFAKEGKIHKEIEYTKRSLIIAEELESKIDVTIALGNLAQAYYTLGYHETAINYTLESMKISKEIKDSVGIGYMNMQMGDNYEAIKKYDEAFEYYKNAVEIFEKENIPKQKANALEHCGSILVDKKSYSEATNYFSEAFATYEKLNDKSSIALVERSISKLFLKQNKIIKAEQYALSAFNYYKNTELKPALFNSSILLTKINIKLRNTAEAKRFLDLAQQLVQELYDLPKRVKFQEQKSNYYELVGNYKLAFQNQKLLNELLDSIQIKKDFTKALDIQIKYDAEKKQEENELLQTQNKLQQLKAEESRVFRNFSILTIFLLVLVGIVLFIRYRAKIQLNNKLREANATKDKFFSIISHDLKNPFTTLLGYTDMLILEYKNFSEEERKNYIGSIQKSAKHTFNLLENLLSWSRTQRGEIQIQKTELSVSELIDRTFTLVSETAKNKNIELRKEISNELTIFADDETISTVIRNLVTNAIKFTKENGLVKVSAIEQNNNVQISVEDNGIGIDPNNVVNLFRIDFHHTTEGTANEKGTGLGLILCKEFMKKNDGEIFVESTLGKGSRFTISLTK